VDITIPLNKFASVPVARNVQRRASRSGVNTMHPSTNFRTFGRAIGACFRNNRRHSSARVRTMALRCPTLYALREQSLQTTVQRTDDLTT
jgi:hypothetical protein